MGHHATPVPRGGWAVMSRERGPRVGCPQPEAPPALSDELRLADHGRMRAAISNSSFVQPRAERWPTCSPGSSGKIRGARIEEEPDATQERPRARPRGP